MSFSFLILLLACSLEAAPILRTGLDEEGLASVEEALRRRLGDTCTDDNWTNPYGFSCQDYATHWCVNGEKEEWACGATFDFPEQHCCACGKGEEAEDDGQCHDTPNWTNPEGHSCGVYEQNNLCEDGNFVQWAIGEQWNEPEHNCCICGKGTWGDPVDCEVQWDSAEPCNSSCERPRTVTQHRENGGAHCQKFEEAVEQGLVDDCVAEEDDCPASCEDTADWDNNFGYGCDIYTEQSWCDGSGATDGWEWALGSTYNNPESNCCLCGKGVDVEILEPCVDTPEWANQDGHGCGVYVQNDFCARGVAFPGDNGWGFGDDWNNPEESCCECGKGTCQDNPVDWKYNHFHCHEYALNKWCENGSISNLGGEDFGYPEHHCCVCGGGMMVMNSSGAADL